MPIVESPPGSGTYVLTGTTQLPGIWATPDDVLALIGITVPLSAVNEAARTIEILTGLIESVPRVNIADRDLYWLKLAVCYQAAWLPTQPDFLERTDISAATQDGQSVTLKPDALVLAPMARRSLKRLSWRGARSVGLYMRPREVTNVNDDDYEDTLNWQPI